jgi:acyl dehydratase
MGGLYFEDVEVGDSYTAGPYRVAKSEIIRFAQQYDPVPEKIDEEAAARSIFGGLTACAPHTFSSIYFVDVSAPAKPPFPWGARLGRTEDAYRGTPGR